MDNAVLNEAYDRFRDTGPEWGENGLTNHGPMAAEVLVRRGHEKQVHRWVEDAYLRRLPEPPAASEAITDDTWRAALAALRAPDDPQDAPATRTRWPRPCACES